jgi:hypothetical protein
MESKVGGIQNKEHQMVGIEILGEMLMKEERAMKKVEREPKLRNWREPPSNERGRAG